MKFSTRDRPKPNAFGSLLNLMGRKLRESIILMLNSFTYISMTLPPVYMMLAPLFLWSLKQISVWQVLLQSGHCCSWTGPTVHLSVWHTSHFVKHLKQTIISMLLFGESNKVLGYVKIYIRIFKCMYNIIILRCKIIYVCLITHRYITANNTC